MISALLAASDLTAYVRSIQPGAQDPTGQAVSQEAQTAPEADRPLSGVNPPSDPRSLVKAQELGGDAARGSPDQLTPEEQQIVRELQRTDREVRAHERAHAAAGGPYAGTPHYEYTRGPDGKQYAVGGEVSIDVSPGKDPAATVEKMETVLRAALAPADPSPQDRRVAAQARAELAKAQAEAQKEKLEEQRGGGNSSPVDGSLFAQARKAYEKSQGLQRAQDSFVLFQEIQPLVA